MYGWLFSRGYASKMAPDETLCSVLITKRTLVKVAAEDEYIQSHHCTTQQHAVVLENTKYAQRDSVSFERLPLARTVAFRVRRGISVGPSQIRVLGRCSECHNAQSTHFTDERLPADEHFARKKQNIYKKR